MISAVTGLVTLGAASVVTGGIGVFGAALMIFLMPEPLKQRRPAGPRGIGTDTPP